VRVTLSILLLLSAALVAPTAPGAVASAAPSTGCGCGQDSMAACAMGCCTDDAVPADDASELCDCGLTEAVPAAPAVPTTSGSEKPIRDVAQERAPGVAATAGFSAATAVHEDSAPPPLHAPVPSDLCVWRN